MRRINRIAIGTIVCMTTTALLLVVVFAVSVVQQKLKHHNATFEQSPALVEDRTYSLELLESSNSVEASEVLEAPDTALISQSPGKTDGEYQITAIGDSLTQGVGDRTEQGGYVGILQQVIQQQGVDVRVDNLGVNGYRTDQLLKRIQSDEVSTKLAQADLIVLSIGSNNLMQVVKKNLVQLTMQPFQEGAELFEKQLVELIEQIRNLNATSPVYMLGLYNPFAAWFEDVTEMDDIMQDWNDRLDKTSQMYDGVTFVPISDLFVDGPLEWMGDDLIHPSEIGYQLIAERVLSVMQVNHSGTG